MSADMLKGGSASTVSGLSLESYVQMYKALSETGSKVHIATPVKGCYKLQDLRQLLCIHGLSATKFNRTELLQAIKGKPLVNPFSGSCETADAGQRPSAPSANSSSQVQATSSTACHVELTVADLSSDLLGAFASAGWLKNGARILRQPLHQLQEDLLAGFNRAVRSCDSTAAPGLSGAVAAPPPETAIGAHRHQHASIAGDQQDNKERDQAERKGTSDARVPYPAISMQQQQAPAAGHILHASDGWRTAKRARTSVSSPPLQHWAPKFMDSAPQQAAGGQLITGPQHRSAGAAAPAAAVSILQSPATTKGASQEQLHTITRTSLSQPEPPYSVQQVQVTLQPTPARQDSVHTLGCAEGPIQQDLYARNQPQGHQQQPAEQDESANEVRDGHAVQLADDLTADVASLPLVNLLRQAGLDATSSEWHMLHTHRLLKQLQMFAATGASASQEDLVVNVTADAAPGSSCKCGTDALLGRHVGFFLTEEMRITGLKNTQLTLPAGVYRGRVVKYLGSACQPQLCEMSCPGGHQHYRARILPPQCPDRNQVELLGAEDVVASIAQAHAAASGRPVLLILDLHPELRCTSFSSMLRLETNKLQDAWVLLSGEAQRPSSREGTSIQCQSL